MEETTAAEMQNELHNKSAALMEAQLTIAQLQQKIQLMGEKHESDMDTLRNSFLLRMKEMTKVSNEDSAAQKTVEGEPQNDAKQWEEDSTALLLATKELRQSVMDNLQSWSEMHNNVSATVDELRGRMGQRSKTRRGSCLDRLSTCCKKKSSCTVEEISPTSQ